MQATASDVFSRAGFRTMWVHCLRTSGELVQSFECNRPTEATNISLTIIENWKTVARRVMGSGTLGTGRATVYYQRVRQIGRMSDCHSSVGKILGYVAAHEIAHLILDSPEHSATGVLKAIWSKSDLREMAQDQFWFAGEFRPTR